MKAGARRIEREYTDGDFCATVETRHFLHRLPIQPVLTN
jgi:hypothetical protein